jgi:hypothetical protein
MDSEPINGHIFDVEKQEENNQNGTQKKYLYSALRSYTHTVQMETIGRTNQFDNSETPNGSTSLNDIIFFYPPTNRIII